MPISLPQNEDATGRTERQSYLQKKRDEYRYSYQGAGPPHIEKLPKEEMFDRREKVSMYSSVAIAVVELGYRALGHFMWDGMCGRIEKYDNLYLGARQLSVQKRWAYDEEFGRQRLVGTNPVLLRRCDRIPENFPVTDALVRGCLGSAASLAAALDQRRLYLLDFAIVEGLVPPDKKGRQLLAPICLFFVDDRKELMPIAIQLGQSPAAGPIFTPNDSKWLWTTAKAYVQSTDSTYHEVASHLLRTHMLMETFWIAAVRCLHERHPLHALLAPHSVGTIAINDYARSMLCAKGGPVDKIIGSGIDQSLQLLDRAYARWRFDEMSLPCDLRRRGVEDPAALPNYFYRDDGLAIWGTLRTFVDKVVRRWYPQDEDLRDDSELAAWVAELAGPARVAGLPGGGQVPTRTQLIDIVTQMVFLATAEHSSVNNGQFEYFGYIPDAPAAMYLPPPRDKRPLTERDLGRRLPGLWASIEQIAVVKLLSTPQPIRLGDYGPLFFDEDVATHEAVEQLHDDLCELSCAIRRRNRRQEVPYVFLDPWLISQSIRI